MDHTPHALPRTWSIAAVFLVATLLPVTRATGLEPERTIAQHSHRTWQGELPQSSIHAILQTSDGYLWCGTYEGLVRFDGVRFTVFDDDTTADLPGSTILDLEEDRAGRLWIATNAGLTVMESGSFTTLTAADGMPGEVVRVVREDRDGALWIGTDAGLVVRRDGRITTAKEIPQLAGTPIQSLEPDPDGGMWIGTNRGLFHLEDLGVGSFTTADGLPDDNCGVLRLAADGTLWIGTNHGLVRMDSDGFTTLSRADGLPGDFIRALLEDRSGALWIGTEEGGLARLMNDRIETFDAEDGLSHDFVRSLLEDREGNLWIGTNAGLNQLRAATITPYTSREGLGANFARTVFQDRAGILWVGTDGGGLNRMHDGRFTVYTTAEGLANNSVRSIAEDDAGGLWIGTRGGLSRRAGGRFETFTTRDGLSSDLVRVVYNDRHGRLWIGTEGGGLNLRGDDGFTVTRAADGLAGNDVRAIYEDTRGCLWIGTYTGLSTLCDGRLRSYRTEDGIADNIVFAFHEDQHGNIWVGTDNGLSLFRDDRIAVIDTGAGLVNDKVLQILQDDSDHLWLSSNRGVTRVSLASLYDVADGRAEVIEDRKFGTADGMEIGQCNGASQPAGWRTDDGHLWFPTPRGVIEIDPDNLRHNRLPPPVLVEELITDREHVRPGDPTVIPPGRDNFEFRYTALSFTAPEKVQFRYILEGFDRRWTEAAGRRVAYYTKLPPGRYTFRVTAANNDDVWNRQGATLPFEIDAAPWQTWWARALFAVTAAAILLGALRLRLRALDRRNRLLEEMVAVRTVELDDKNTALAEKVQQLEVSERRAHDAMRRASEANRAKSVFLSNMSHELRTPLNSIIGFAGILHGRLEGKIEDRLFSFVSNIHSSGKHLLALINDLLDLTKIEAGRMEICVEPIAVAQVVDSVLRLMRGVTEQRHITVEVRIPADLPLLTADPVRLKQILFNLVSNAVKFSPDESRITVRAAHLDPDDSTIECETIQIDVIDRGIGIAAENQKLVFEEFRQVETGSDRRYEGTGLGLALVTRLTALQGGSVKLASEPGRGSTFSVYLPLVVEPHGVDSAEPPAFTDVDEKLSLPAQATGPDAKVLVVEDDPLAFHQLAATLEADGFNVLAVRTGEDALRVLEAERPSLITLDLLLPGLDGWEVLRQIKSNHRTRDIPVLIITRRENREICLTLGADDFFIKPVDRTHFLRRVHELAGAGDDEKGFPKIIVIDDEPVIGELLRAVLEPAGYRIMACLDGKTGVQRVREERPDLVILDLLMPGMSGFEVAHALHSDPTTARIPIIVLTVKQLADDERAALADSISALITKGTDCALQLSDTVRRLLA